LPGEGETALFTIDLSNPTSPSLIGSGLRVPREAHGAKGALIVIDDVLYAALGDDGVGAFAIGQPSTPAYLGAQRRFFVGGQQRDLYVTTIARSGSDLVVSDWSANLSVLVDTDRPGLPVVRSLVLER
jgi:hypothetical protein